MLRDRVAQPGRQRRHLQAFGLAQIGEFNASAARVADDGDAPPAQRWLGVERCGHVEQRQPVLDQNRAGLTQNGAGDRKVLRQRGGVARRGTLAGAAAPGLQDHHRLVRRDFTQRLHQPRPVGQRFEHQRDDPRVRVRAEKSHRVDLVHVGLVARRQHLREADCALRGA